MKCKDIMTKSESLSLCDSSCTVKDAAQIMKKVNTGAVPIVDKSKNVLGVVTDRDITLKAIALDKKPSDIQINELMSKNVITVHENDSIDKAAKKMKQNKVRRVLVLDEQDKLSGIISLGDIAVNSDLDEHQKVETLEQISQPVSSR